VLAWYVLHIAENIAASATCRSDHLLKLDHDSVHRTYNGFQHSILLSPLLPRHRAYIRYRRRFAHFQPQTYLNLTHAASAPAIHIPIGTSIVLSQLANLYLLFAINEALVLRSTSDLRVWRTLLFGLLIADLGHLFSVAKLGSDIYWRVQIWSAIDWGNVAFVYIGAMSRIAFLCSVGLGNETRGTKVKERVKKI
jgi:hypothetical protein